jgi:putative sigma-54 modulation protein
MNVHFTARQMTLTPELRQYCEKRLNSLEKLMGSVLEVDVICSVERNRHKAEIYVKAKGASLFVVEETPEMLNSLNRAFDSLEKKIKKEREKFRERKRRSSRVTKEIPYVSEPGETEKRVVRTRDFSLKPMALEEALVQFDVEKRDVFVFRRPGTEKWAVLYRRKDGNYGLVEPE